MVSDVRVVEGNCLDLLGGVADSSVQCVVTSPPYWGVRKYGVGATEWPDISFAPMVGLPEVEVGGEVACLGEEESLWSYIGHLVGVFREVRRVLSDDGVVWLNVGDCYASRPKGSLLGQDKSGLASVRSQEVASVALGANKIVGSGLKSKDLVMVPARIALALQGDGWWVRSHVVWHKTNPMRESVGDRCTCAHETIWQLSKSARYSSDFGAIRTEAKPETYACADRAQSDDRKYADGGPQNQTIARKERGHSRRHAGFDEQWDRMSKVEQMENGANRVNVWPGATAQYSGEHFAVMPEWLAARCVLSGSVEGSLVLDPFCGVGTVGLVASRLGRRFFGMELRGDYAVAARARIEGDAPLFVSVGE